MRRQNRLRTSDGYARIYRTGVRARRRALTAIVAPQAPATGPRIGVVCSRTVGNAVVRNRVKRRLRAAAGPLVPQLRPDVLVVLQGNTHTATEDFRALHVQVRQALLQAGAIDG